MKNEKNMFEVALRNQFRFPFRGNATVEDLWVLGVVDLDSVFRDLSKELKKTSEESLLDVESTKNEELKLKIKIVEYIFTVKVREEKERKSNAEKQIRKQELLKALKEKQDKTLTEMDEGEIRKMIDEL